MAANAFQPMDLGEIFSSTFSLIKRTFASSALPSLLILFLLSLLTGATVRSYFEVMADLAASGALSQPDDPEIAQEMAGRIVGVGVPLFFSGVLYVFGVIFVQVLNTITSWEAINGRAIGFGEAFRRAIGRPFWMSLLQTILLLVVLFAAILIVSVIGYALVGGSQRALPMVYVILLLLLIYPIIATIFRIHKVTIEDRGPWQGMIASIALVKGNWWRTFGILVLVGVAVIALSILVSIATGAGTSMMFQSPANSNDPEAAAAALIAARDAYTWTYIIANGILSAFVVVFFFTLLTPMYIDLRARRDEFLIEEGDEADADYPGKPEA